MKLLSQIFQPIVSVPKNAKIKSNEITCISQKLLYECGLVRPTSHGLFTLLPLAQRVLDKLEAIVRTSIESAGAQRISLPALTSSALWETSGRLQDCGSELLKLKDRHDKKYVLSPTHEEAIAELLADVGPVSYKQLPLLLYQLSRKYRDEHRPKHGLLRAREFLMMDAYGAHASIDCVSETYIKMTEAYRQVFEKLDVNVYKVKAPSGEMGGLISHEWHVPAAAGEDIVMVCESCGKAVLGMEKSNQCVCGGKAQVTSSIEVGHTFILGTKYSEALGANYITAQGTNSPIIMSCYGIGVSRLLASCIETKSDGVLKWPKAIAPYSVIIIGPKEGSKEWASGGWERVQELSSHLSQIPGLEDDVIIDDRHHMTIGKRLLQAEKLGYPLVVVCGKYLQEQPPLYETRMSSQRQDQLLTMAQLITTLNP